MMEKWTARRGTKADNMYAAPTEYCMILDSPNHHAFGQIIVRMNSKEEDDERCLERLAVLVAAPEAIALLQAMIDESECYCMEPQEALGRNPCAFCKARELLARLKNPGKQPCNPRVDR